MKRRLPALLLAPALALALSGCVDDFFLSDGPSAKGSVDVEVVFGTGLRSYALDDMVTFTLKAHHPNDVLDSTYSTNRKGDSERKVFDNVPAVDALVTVSATKKGEKAAEATASVKVPAHGVATVSVTLRAEN
jgi:hypothetical protein